MNSHYVISVDECWRKEVFNSRTLEDALKIFENLRSKWWSLCKQSMIWVEWSVIITRRMNYTYQEYDKAWWSALESRNREKKFERKVFDLLVENERMNEVWGERMDVPSLRTWEMAGNHDKVLWHDLGMMEGVWLVMEWVWVVACVIN